MANRGVAATASTIVINTTIGFMHDGGQLTLVHHALTNKDEISVKTSTPWLNSFYLNGEWMKFWWAPLILLSSVRYQKKKST